jgi:hypothetical protein
MAMAVFKGRKQLIMYYNVCQELVLYCHSNMIMSYYNKIEMSQ